MSRWRGIGFPGGSGVRRVRIRRLRAGIFAGPRLALLDLDLGDFLIARSDVDVSFTFAAGDEEASSVGGEIEVGHGPSLGPKDFPVELANRVELGSGQVLCLGYEQLAANLEPVLGAYRAGVAGQPGHVGPGYVGFRYGGSGGRRKPGRLRRGSHFDRRIQLLPGQDPTRDKTRRNQYQNKDPYSEYENLQLILLPRLPGVGRAAPKPHCKGNWNKGG